MTTMSKDKLLEKSTERESAFTQLNIKSSLSLNSLLRFMKSRADQETLRPLENNTLIFKANTKRLNLRNLDSKAIAYRELVKTEPKLIDSSENSTPLRLITLKLKTSRSSSSKWLL